MTADRREVLRLLGEAGPLPESPMKLAMIEEAARLADALQDPDLGFKARSDTMRTALHVGRGDELAVAFAWCLAAHDRNPDRFPGFDVLWAYRWVIGALAGFPAISREQIEGLLNDMATRYEIAGASPRPIHFLRVDAAFELGDFQAGWTALREAAGCPRDRFSDEVVSEKAVEIGFQAAFLRHNAALRSAAPLLDGKVGNPFFTPFVYRTVLTSLLVVGRAGDAVSYYRTACRTSRVNTQNLYNSAHLLQFLALTDNLPTGLDLFRREAGTGLDRVCAASQYLFGLAAALLFDRVAAAGQKRVTVRAPGFAPDRPDGVFTPAELADRLRAEAAAIAARFDARNGTPLFTDWMTKQARLIRYATPYPL